MQMSNPVIHCSIGAARAAGCATSTTFRSRNCWNLHLNPISGWWKAFCLTAQTDGWDCIKFGKESEMAKIKILFERWWVVLALALCLPFFYNAAVENEQRVDYLNNGFFT